MVVVVVPEHVKFSHTNSEPLKKLVSEREKPVSWKCVKQEREHRNSGDGDDAPRGLIKHTHTHTHTNQSVQKPCEDEDEEATVAVD